MRITKYEFSVSSVYTSIVLPDCLHLLKWMKNMLYYTTVTTLLLAYVKILCSAFSLALVFYDPVLN